MSAKPSYTGRDFSGVDDLWPEETKEKVSELKSLSIHYIGGESYTYTNNAQIILDEIASAVAQDKRRTNEIVLESTDRVKKLTVFLNNISFIEEIWT